MFAKVGELNTCTRHYSYLAARARLINSPEHVESAICQAYSKSLLNVITRFYSDNVILGMSLDEVNLHMR